MKNRQNRFALSTSGDGLAAWISMYHVAVQIFQDARFSEKFSRAGLCFLMTTFLVLFPNALFASCAVTKFDHVVAVRHVHDGDSLVLRGGAKVRIIGINAPEIASRNKPGEPFGKQARDRLRKKIRSAKLGIIFDRERRDSHGRLLAHVFLANGENLGVWLIKQGLAQAITIPPNQMFASCYQEAENDAHMQRQGLWSIGYFRPRKATRVHKTGFMRVTGCVREVKESGRSFLLDMSPDFVLRIPKNATWSGVNRLSSGGLMQTFFRQRVIAKGWVYQKGQKKYMKVLHPSAIWVIEKDDC